MLKLGARTRVRSIGHASTSVGGLTVAQTRREFATSKHEQLTRREISDSPISIRLDLCTPLTVTFT